MNSTNGNNVHPYLMAFGKDQSEIKYYFIVLEQKNLIAVCIEKGLLQ